ncbi:hypothetical protein CKM354_001125900 [Cercospora kikuchii]|uniref:Uncharacterized protein n=1 Tax=Cercospora kikuchii TaxID=84275 RepID=A0A9P3CSM5_9PEZI|nr:uncharacterized protein CKM354_001125900 [Cercospora kikuchii]GIZ48188.1 hypothetical protein CKM354_001125900 [Cercospora kikuchii]
MSSSPPNDTVADRFVGLLTALQPNDILQHRQCREAILDFIGRSEETFLHELFDKIKRPRKRRRRDSDPTESQVGAEAFFADKKRIHRERGPVGRQPSPDVRLLVQAVKDLESGMDISPEAYSGSYDRSDDTTPTEPIPNRQRCTIARLNNIEKTSRTAEGKRRLSLLRIEYEVDRLLPSAQRMRTSSGNIESDIVAAEREFSQLSGIDTTRVNALRKLARPYIHISRRENGLGLLLMLGSQSRHLWKSFSELAFSWLWQFCEEHLQHILAKAQNLQMTACRMVQSDFINSGVEPNELRGDGHIFAKHFLCHRPSSFSPDQGPGLDALATAAEMVHGNSQGTPASGSPREENHGCVEVPSSTPGNPVTSVREGGETQSSVPALFQAMGDGTSWGTSSNTDEYWESMMLPFPQIENWWELLNMPNI